MSLTLQTFLLSSSLAVSSARLQATFKFGLFANLTRESSLHFNPSALMFCSEILTLITIFHFSETFHFDSELNSFYEIFRTFLQLILRFLWFGKDFDLDPFKF